MHHHAAMLALNWAAPGTFVTGPQSGLYHSVTVTIYLFPPFSSFFTLASNLCSLAVALSINLIASRPARVSIT